MTKSCSSWCRINLIVYVSDQFNEPYKIDFRDDYKLVILNCWWYCTTILCIKLSITSFKWEDQNYVDFLRKFFEVGMAVETCFVCCLISWAIMGLLFMKELRAYIWWVFCSLLCLGVDNEYYCSSVLDIVCSSLIHEKNNK